MTRRRGHEGEYEEVLAAVGTEKPRTQGHYHYERMIEMKGEGNWPRNCTARGQVVKWLSEVTRLTGPGTGPREEPQSAGAGTARAPAGAKKRKEPAAAGVRRSSRVRPGKAKLEGPSLSASESEEESEGEGRAKRRKAPKEDLDDEASEEYSEEYSEETRRRSTTTSATFAERSASSSCATAARWCTVSVHPSAGRGEERRRGGLLMTDD